MTETFSFAADSDLHFPDLRSPKRANVSRIISSDVDFLIVAGDLTDHGTDGRGTFCLPGGEDELGPFLDNYYDPISKHMKIYLCAGNHDNYVPKPYLHKPVMDLIKEKHGGLTYSFDYKGVHFACCHIYPDAKILKWLKKDLDKVEGPIVIYFHYNLTGAYSNWWAKDKDEDPELAEKRREEFFKVIANKDVKLIITGHSHVNMEHRFLPKAFEGKGHPGFKAIIVGGPGFALCDWDGEEMYVRFY